MDKIRLVLAIALLMLAGYVIGSSQCVNASFESDQIDYARQVESAEMQIANMAMVEKLFPGTFTYGEIEGAHMDYARACYRLTGSYSLLRCEIARRNWLGF